MRSIVVAFFLLASSPIFGAEPSKGSTGHEVDEDFPFVGEYLGKVTHLQNGVWESTRIGLQVVAVGEGRFEAIEYFGGLPGLGWNGVDKVVLPGTRDGKIVKIDALPVGIELDGFVGQVGSPSTSTKGTVRRIDRASPTLGRRPPAEAIVLFDGRNHHGLSNVNVTDDGLLCVGAETVDAYSDFTLHVEFRLPYMPVARSQGRANSGVYLQRRYEVQILDSFGRPSEFNTAASLYRTKPADLNMSFPPLRWQTYDIRFRAAQFNDGKKTTDARLTVWHNGVKVQDDIAIPNKTGHGKPEGPNPLPTLFQDHGNPVHFRNIWLIDNQSHPEIDATPKIGHPAHVAAPPVTACQFAATR